jgi:pyridoxal phosphate enzyme (YggS family)
VSNCSDQIRRNVEGVRARIESAARRSGRTAASVKLVAVTKMSSAELVRPLVAAGVLDLGENYPQELWKKIERLADLVQPVRWHLIGHLQTNKAKRTLPLVRMIHAVDSLKLLRLLDLLARDVSNPPSICLQVNTSHEESKHGWSSAEILADADAIAACRSIPVVGLMTIAGWGTDNETARPSFINLRQTREALKRRTDLPLSELSMGMSGDFEAAIEEGATLVRVGSALFEGVQA